jgi:hypothetical protein
LLFDWMKYRIFVIWKSQYFNNYMLLLFQLLLTKLMKIVTKSRKTVNLCYVAGFFFVDRHMYCQQNMLRYKRQALSYNGWKPKTYWRQTFIIRHHYWGCGRWSLLTTSYWYYCLQNMQLQKVCSLWLNFIFIETASVVGWLACSARVR